MYLLCFVVGNQNVFRWFDSHYAVLVLSCLYIWTTCSVLHGVPSTSTSFYLYHSCVPIITAKTQRTAGLWCCAA
jgi:hypothetical protein